MSTEQVIVDGWPTPSGYANGRIDGDSFQLTRYLHCWQADFGRTRSGDETSFYFKISIRDLPDIRYQQGRQGATGLEGLTQFLP